MNVVRQQKQGLQVFCSSNALPSRPAVSNKPLASKRTVSRRVVASPPSVEQAQNTSVKARTPRRAQQPSVSHDDLPLEFLNPQAALIQRILSHPAIYSWAEGGDLASIPPQESTDKPAAAEPVAPVEKAPRKEEPPKTETCMTAHPGTISCSTTEVAKDVANRSVVINLKTTVRLANPSTSSLSVDDLEQLGYHAAVQRLQEASAAPLTSSDPTSVQSRHEAVLSLLANGKVISADRQINQYGHVSFRCVLEDNNTHHRVQALVKPSVEGHCNGWHRAEVEVVAYRLNRLLGMDYVPPCAYKRDVDVDWQHFSGCVFMYWAESAQELRSAPMDKWGVPWRVMLSDTRILDVLIQNSDRHHGHFLQAQHWAQGTGGSPASAGWTGSMRPALIDHAAGFRQDAWVEMNHENAFKTGDTEHISARTYLRLRCLNHTMVAAAVGDLLTKSEIDCLMRRRDEVVAYFDRLVLERGYERVVVESDA